MNFWSLCILVLAVPSIKAQCPAGQAQLTLTINEISHSKGEGLFESKSEIYPIVDGIKLGRDGNEGFCICGKPDYRYKTPNNNGIAYLNWAYNLGCRLPTQLNIHITVNDYDCCNGDDLDGSGILAIGSLGAYTTPTTKTLAATAGHSMTVKFTCSWQYLPTKPPTKAPTKKPTKAPTKKPTKAPTKKPTKAPTKKPTKAPTKKPTKAPTKKPTKTPTKTPTTSIPSKTPTANPSSSPTSSIPTAAPTSSLPTYTPTTSIPSVSPSLSPSESPTTSLPSLSPTISPTKSFPTSSPTISAPTSSPTTSAPTLFPTVSAPTLTPTTSTPSESPTLLPTFYPSATPSGSPSEKAVLITDTNRGNSNSKSSATTIIVIIVVILFLAILGFFLVMFVKRNSSNKKEKEDGFFVANPVYGDGVGDDKTREGHLTNPVYAVVQGNQMFSIPGMEGDDDGDDDRYDAVRASGAYDSPEYSGAASEIISDAPQLVYGKSIPKSNNRPSVIYNQDQKTYDIPTEKNFELDNYSVPNKKPPYWQSSYNDEPIYDGFDASVSET